MILDNKNSFFIKHFRLINLFLLFLVLYIIIKSTFIYTFLSDFINNKYVGEFNSYALKYVDIFMFSIVIIIIILCSLFIIQLKRLSLNKKLYISLLIFYSFIFITLMINFNIFTYIQLNKYSILFLKVYKFFSLILIIIQCIYALCVLLKVLGINNKDLDININITKELRKNTREWKYYFIENKIIILLILIMFFLISGSVGFFRYETTLKSVKEGRNLEVNAVKIRIDNSYLTNTKYNGNKISADKYIVVKLKFDNAFKMNVNNFELINNKKIYYPQMSLADNFSDIGYIYKGEVTNFDYNYIIVYKLNKTEKIKNTILRIKDNSTKNKNFKLNLIEDSDIKTISEYDLNEEIEFKESNLGKTSLTIKDYNIKDGFTEEYKYCVSKKCYVGTKNIKPIEVYTSNKIILRMKVNLKKGKGVYLLDKYNDYSSFLEAFGKISYNINDDVKKSKIVAINIDNINSKYNYFLIDKSVIKSKHYDLEITIRNKRYIISLK